MDSGELARSRWHLDLRRVAQHPQPREPLRAARATTRRHRKGTAPIAERHVASALVRSPAKCARRPGRPEISKGSAWPPEYHLSALDPKRWGTTAISACSVCDGPVRWRDQSFTKPGSRSWSPPMSCRCSSTPARPPASPRCWAHSVSYASSCAASSRHAAEKAASLVPRRRRDRPETADPRSQVVPSQGLSSARLMARQSLETPKPQVRSFLHLRLAVGRVGLEPKLVMRLICENAAEADIHIPLRPTASASIRGNRTAVRYVPHRYKAALARTGAGNPPGPICGSASRHGPPAVQSASSAHLPPLARVGDPPYRPSTYRNLTRRAYSPRLLGNGATRLGTSGSAL